MTQHDPYALCRQCRFDVIIAVVIMIIGLQSYRSAFIQQVFQIEISDECIVIDRVVSISEVPIENQSIVQ